MSEQSDFGTFGRYIEIAVDRMSPEMKDAYDFKSLRGIVPGPPAKLICRCPGISVKSVTHCGVLEN